MTTGTGLDALRKHMGGSTARNTAVENFEPIANADLEELLDGVEEDMADMEEARGVLVIMESDGVDMEGAEIEMEGVIKTIGNKIKSAFEKLGKAIDALIAKIEEYIRTKLDARDEKWLDKHGANIKEGSNLDAKKTINTKAWKSSPGTADIYKSIQADIDGIDGKIKTMENSSGGYKTEPSVNAAKEGNKQKAVDVAFFEGEKSKDLPLSKFATEAYMTLWKDFRTERKNLKDMIAALKKLKKSVKVDGSKFTDENKSAPVGEKTSASSMSNALKRIATEQIGTCRKCLGLVKERRHALKSAFNQIISAVKAAEKAANKNTD